MPGKSGRASFDKRLDWEQNTRHSIREEWKSLHPQGRPLD